MRNPEQYDIIGWATLAAKLDQEISILRGALREALTIGSFQCKDMHHALKDRHELGQECPVEKRAKELCTLYLGDIAN